MISCHRMSCRAINPICRLPEVAGPNLCVCLFICMASAQPKDVIAFHNGADVCFPLLNVEQLHYHLVRIDFWDCLCWWNGFLLSAESAQVEKPAATQSSSSSGSGGLNASSGPHGSSASTVPVSPVLQSPAPPLLHDPTLLRQLLPALQTALQLNNASVDMAKINEGKKEGRRCVTTVSIQLAAVALCWALVTERHFEMIPCTALCFWTDVKMILPREMKLSGLTTFFFTVVWS